MSFKSFLIIILNIFYGFSNLFRRYDYIVFSNIIHRKKINGYYEDRFVDNIIRKLNGKRVLLVEFPKTKHFPRKKICTRYIVSNFLFLAIGEIYKLLYLKHMKMDNSVILDNINSSYTHNVDYHDYIKRFWANYKIKLFNILKGGDKNEEIYSSKNSPLQ